MGAPYHYVFLRPCVDGQCYVSAQIYRRPVPQPRYTQDFSPGGKRRAWIPGTKDPLTKRTIPHPIHGWKEYIRLVFSGRDLPADWPLTGPVQMGFEFRIDGPGDLDNLIKAVKDALKGLAYRDDRQVKGYLWPTCVRKPRPGEVEGLRLVMAWDIPQALDTAALKDDRRKPARAPAKGKKSPRRRALPYAEARQLVDRAEKGARP